MSKYLVTESIQVVVDDDEYILQYLTDTIRKAIGEADVEKRRSILNSMKKYLKSKKPKKRTCKQYDPQIDGPYEQFCMYYTVLKILTFEKQGDTTLCSFLNYNFDRWADLGMPSISAYNKWKEPVKYTALILTTIASIFKVVRAKQDGGASFVGTLLQGVAHGMFVVYFTVLSNEPALAVPKMVGLIMAVITCIWILEAGKGFL